MDEDESCHKMTKQEKDSLLHSPDVCCGHSSNGHAPLLPNDAASNATLLLKTLNFATLKHSTQRRKDPEKTPYINHPIGVAHILASEGGVEDIAVLQVRLV